MKALVSCGLGRFGPVSVLSRLPQVSGPHSILLSEGKDCSILDGLDFHISGMHLALIRQEGTGSLT